MFQNTLLGWKSNKSISGSKNKKKDANDTSTKPKALAKESPAPFKSPKNDLLAEPAVRPRNRRNTISSKDAIPNYEDLISDNSYNSKNSFNTNNNVNSKATTSSSSSQKSAVAQKIGMISLSDDSDEDSDDISSVTKLASQSKQQSEQPQVAHNVVEQSTTLENGEIMFSNSSLVPLGTAIQMKYDVKFSEGFPRLIDATLEANSITFMKRTENAKKNIDEIELLTEEATKKSKTLTKKGDNIESKADVALGQVKKTRSEVQVIMHGKLSICAYIVLFFLFLVHLVTNVFSSASSLMKKLFRVNIGTAKKAEKSDAVQ